MTKSTSSVSPRWFSVQDVAMRWQVSERTVRRHIKCGLLPARKIGSRVRIHEMDLSTCEYRLPQQSDVIKELAGNPCS
jgi:excisionase family DNA binding protein